MEVFKKNFKILKIVQKFLQKVALRYFTLQLFILKCHQNFNVIELLDTNIQEIWSFRTCKNLKVKILQFSKPSNTRNMEFSQKPLQKLLKTLQKRLNKNSKKSSFLIIEN
jgi:hypothetical protein